MPVISEKQSSHRASAADDLLPLCESQLFAGVGDARLGELCDRAVVSTVERGALVYGPFDTSDVLYVVAQGTVRLASADPDGRQLTLAIIDRGSVFGEGALLEEGAAGVFAEAIEHCRIYSIPADQLRAMIQREPDVGVNLLLSVGSRLRRMQELSHELAYWSVHRRLAHQICMLAERYGRPTLSGDVMVARVFTHAELADMVGATRQTVSECIATLMRLGILERRRRRIVVRDRPALVAFGTER